MFSSTDIANKALFAIGQRKKIGALTESSAAATALNVAYDPCRQEALEAYPWNFAIKTGNLNLLAAVEPEEWGYAFQLPNDFLRLLKLTNQLDITEYEIMGDRLFCDLSEVNIKYLYNLEDTTKFSSQFVNAFSYRLAAEVALGITGKADLEQLNWQKYWNAVAGARASDSSSNRKKETRYQAFLNARKGVTS